MQALNHNNNKNEGRQQGRHGARCMALQALYQWQYTQDSFENIEQQFAQQAHTAHIDYNYFNILLRQVILSVQQLDTALLPVLDRPFSRLTPIELNVLRIATYELMHCIDIPYKVIIDEALELSKAFGTIDGFKFVNGVLDSLVKQLRPSNPK